jgi:AraC-like DNA-binding protein
VFEASPSRILFESPLVQVGKFRCPTVHPRFGDSGPAKVYCFVFPRTAVWIQHDGSAPFVADSTVVPLYNAGYPYRRRRISRDGDRTDWFGVNATTLRDALSAHGLPAAEAEHRLFARDFSRAPAATFLRQRRVFEYVRANERPDGLYVEESVLTILDDVVSGLAGRNILPVPAPARHRTIAEDARARLNVCYGSDQDLTGFAREVGASTFHLCRIFKRHTGQTIHGYRNQLRLRKSLELLGETHDILRLALALGYSGHSHFTATFHRVFGMTPSAFRLLSGTRRAAAAADVRARERSAVNRPWHV